MTEQELRASITPCIMSGNTWFVFEEIKSYAAAQVAEKEDQITRILSENRALEMTRQRLLFACDANQKAIATKDERIQELGLVIDSFDSEVSAKDARIQELEFVIDSFDSEVSAKDAEIEAMALTYINDIGDCHAAMLKDGERIKELKDELLRLINEQETNCEEYVKTLTEDANYGLNQKIAELTRKLEMQDTMHANTEAVLTEEIKRLREGIRKALRYIEGPHHSGPEPIAIYEILQHLLSPSDVDGETKGNWKAVQASLEELRKELEAENE
jgi:chromosome segregation ATPase